MSPERDREFEQNVSQLIHLLRKIIKGLPSQNGTSYPKLPAKDAAIQFNIHFFSFFPMTSEEWDAIDDMVDAYPFSHEGSGGEFSTELNSEDLDFLRQNGISF